ncbi:hypothetical protein HELRODRAFT_178443 [Helobdella robusta]|uniref:Uncharacterized protein n=1 Tax=Helobdella robusta TaxID=6412 RepID=T1FD63_HELRO|nr:hypothetical protein HELRODRAFT_178443 [Helobdella robusta]ESN97007.1 hypothetical protein HELRODRAFT_178443 [Helobdella robusta]
MEAFMVDRFDIFLQSFGLRSEDYKYNKDNNNEDVEPCPKVLLFAVQVNKNRGNLKTVSIPRSGKHQSYCMYEDKKSKDVFTYHYPVNTGSFEYKNKKYELVPYNSEVCKNNFVVTHIRNVRHVLCRV